MRTPRGRTHWQYLIALALGAGLVGSLWHAQSRAEYVVQIPALAAEGDSPDDPGAFTLKVLWWDQKADPDPVELRWANGHINAFNYGRVSPGRTDQLSTILAFRYAVRRTPHVAHTGIVNVQGVAYGATMIDGSSAGAVMAIGFIALFREDALWEGIALTGTLESGGGIGDVAGLTGKVRAAAREGYHTILIPAGQPSKIRWHLDGLALDLNVTVKEVATIDEAYTIMTGRTL